MSFSLPRVLAKGYRLPSIRLGRSGLVPRALAVTGLLVVDTLVIAIGLIKLAVP